MKIQFILIAALLGFNLSGKAQVLLNEVYSDPGAGKQEFFELYNTNFNSVPESMDNYSLVTFFDISGSIGFYVMDLPNLSVSPKGYFVGSSTIPFNYQGVINSTASDFSWNSLAFTANNGYLKKWVKATANLADGNPNYDEAVLPANFNDFFYRRTGMGASYTLFLYKNGILINAVIFGTGGYASVIPSIIAMPSLNVDMSAASTDFTINFSTYGSANIENVTQDAGSDNGFIRSGDGLCGGWLKSSSQVQHTPKASNGAVTSTDGSISVSSAVTPGTLAAGSTLNYNVLAAPVTSFPIDLQVYLDNGTTSSKVDGLDQFVASNTENVVSDGPFSTNFKPYNAHVLLVVKSGLGCIDKIIFIPNVALLPVKLISFLGNMNGNNIMLEWNVTSNEQAYKFDVEKSLDGKNFETAKLINPSTKNDNETYTYTEVNESAKIYYRLRLTDKSCVVTYSKILVFSKEADSIEKLNIIGTNVTDKLTLSFQSQMNQASEIKILDIGGKLVMKQSFKVSKGNNLVSLSLPVSMNNGMYVASVSGNNFSSSAQFIKQ